MPSPRETHSDLSLKRPLSASALTIVPRFGYPVVVSNALYEISSAMIRSSSARPRIVSDVDICYLSLVGLVIELVKRLNALPIHVGCIA